MNKNMKVFLAIVIAISIMVIAGSKLMIFERITDRLSQDITRATIKTVQI